jgi:hypothetical protein
MRVSCFIFSLLIIVVACREPKREAVDKTTKVFSYYLETAFADSIPDKKHVYILIPKLGCKGCRQDALNELQQQLMKSGEKNYTYIVSPEAAPPGKLAEPGNVLIDTSELIDHINLPVSNIAILKTENGKVISLISIRSETTDSIGYYLRH